MEGMPNKRFALKVLRKLCKWKGEEIIEEVCPDHVANQLKADKEADQLSIFDPRDPFMDSKHNMHGCQAHINHSQIYKQVKA